MPTHEMTERGGDDEALQVGPRARQAGDGGGRDFAQKLAWGLGWFSVGLGAAQLLAPRGLAKAIGVRDDRRSEDAMRAMGVREIANGVGILARPQSAGWLWGRVAGDVLDLGLLGSALRWKRDDGRKVAAAMGAVIGITALDALAAQQLSRAPRVREVKKAITIARSPDEVYRFWRSFENLPRFMDNVEAIDVLDERRSHWRVKAPAGMFVEWDAEIVEDRPGQHIAWRSLEGAAVQTAGTVSFSPAPGGRGTEVKVSLRYDAPGGRVGAAAAKLFGREPGQQTGRDLRRLKQVLEVGQVVHSDASVHWGPHPAQPPAEMPHFENGRHRPAALHERSAEGGTP